MILVIQEVRLGTNQPGKLIVRFRSCGALIIAPLIMHVYWKERINAHNAQSKFLLVTPQHISAKGVPKFAELIIADQVRHRKVMLLLCKIKRPVWVRGDLRI